MGLQVWVYRHDSATGGDNSRSGTLQPNCEPVGNLFSFLSENENVQTIIAFIAIFLALILLSAWLSVLLHTVSKVIPLAGPVDHLSGMVIGIFVGFLFLSGF